MDSHYRAILDYLYGQLPMFQRSGAPAYKADLSRTEALCALLGHPEWQFKSIHVAGTNGKGSVCSALASIFAACGYRVGLYTSPHLFDFRERIRIDGEKIDRDFVVEFVDRTRKRAAELKPSFFEMTTAMAFAYFAEREVDVAVLETGMGGRLDSTNVVRPELSAITSISMDHQRFLGDTLTDIAAEKGGIIKPGVPVVIGENPPEVVERLLVMAEEKKASARVITADAPGYATDLGGAYQTQNMRVVRGCVEELRAQGWALPAPEVRTGAASVVKRTGLRGRWETVSRRPLTIADAAHNEAGVREVVAALHRQTYDRLHVVWGMVADKDAESILALLPREATFYWARPDVPRGKDAEDLRSEASKKGLQGTAYASVKAALEAARAAATPNDLIYIGGSIFVLGEALEER